MADHRPLPEDVSRFLLCASLIAKARVAVLEYLRDFPDDDNLDRRNSLLNQWEAAMASKP